MCATLGVSELAESVSFKRARLPGLEEREYRIADCRQQLLSPIACSGRRQLHLKSA